MKSERVLKVPLGLTAAVIPAAIVVHLGAEGLALGPAGLGVDFIVRHLYLIALLGLSLYAFARAVGLGAGRSEIRRRTALLRARLSRRNPVGLALVVASNLGFFAVTQLAEGVPIVSGTLWLGLAAGIVGSLAAALVVWAFGRALVVAAIETLQHTVRRCAPVATRRFAPAPSRGAATSFSLFVPNRPPPHRPSSDRSSLQKGTPCFQLLARRDRRLRFSSPCSSS